MKLQTQRLGHRREKAGQKKARDNERGAMRTEAQGLPAGMAGCVHINRLYIYNHLHPLKHYIQIHTICLYLFESPYLKQSVALVLLDGRYQERGAPLHLHTMEGHVALAHLLP